MGKIPRVKPFENGPPLDGYHCQTNSLAKIYHFHAHPLSEDMLLGPADWLFPAEVVIAI